MKNKKTIVVITCFFIAVFILTYVLILQKNRAIKKNELNLPALICDDKNDQEIYSSTIEKQDIAQCSCIKNEELKNVCQTSISDVSLYNQALSGLDESFCHNISSEISKEACFSVVKDSVSQLEEKNPEYLANIYASNHNEKAIDIYEKKIKEGDSEVTSFINLAMAYAEKGLREQEQGRSQTVYVDKALAVIENAKSKNQNNSEIFRVEAYINEIKPDYDQSLKLYDKAIELDNKNILAYIGKGHVSRMKGMLEDAVLQFDKAAEFDVEKKYIQIYVNLCNLESSRSNFEKAINNCRIITEKKGIDPVFQSEAYQIMAGIFMRNNDNIQSRNYLLTAKSLTPNDSNLYVVFAKLNMYEKKYIESEINAKKAIEISPTKSSSYLALARALYMQEKYQDSIEAAEKGVGLTKEDVSLLISGKSVIEKEFNYVIANSYSRLGDKNKQEEYEKRASQII